MLVQSWCHRNQTKSCRFTRNSDTNTELLEVIMLGPLEEQAAGGRLSAVTSPGAWPRQRLGNGSTPPLPRAANRPVVSFHDIRHPGDSSAAAAAAAEAQCQGSAGSESESDRACFLDNIWDSHCPTQTSILHPGCYQPTNPSHGVFPLNDEARPPLRTARRCSYPSSRLFSGMSQSGRERLKRRSAYRSLSKALRCTLSTCVFRLTFWEALSGQ
ncbi:hypothetical protein EYF80_010520 [Liparis tanakae]|uniref:Uncharacterized protein n=1 Tax=Liparis tanakae TaxID=230148 RepID=A0A4Z2IN33_9TELE|nr:hypothetical protein EYF80_010520 [Liparis tanakae]